ncbi:MAG: 2-succinyl-6-hydroxy-2,4-cyclohexadiene-1-carboxylate synthase [Flavobacteriaceae bacterium]|nr:2-succinyl-6-hydroxy-2,4-cyclohexadiene-1-carboxylate synthase [Flavobacteriaceae bacterium]|tara:strand:+ start:3302 stop:4120 length:819 start_codon:yes stop_codon:yes gene_type:complete
MLNYNIYRNKKSNSPWITFVHGAGGSSSIWFKQIRFFRRFFNIILIDLRGHGSSRNLSSVKYKSKYTFDDVTNDIIEVLDFEDIKKSHFVGISLGTILIRKLAELSPKYVLSMVMAGAIIELNFRSRILMHIGNLTKSFLPYMWIYKFFAFIVMPNANHKDSRLLFVREAKKLYRKEFIKWYKLTSEIIPLLKIFRKVEIKIPTLYIMGSQDYLFLPSVKELVAKHSFSKLLVFPKCGHLVNIEKPDLFNNEILSFLKERLIINSKHQVDSI